MFVRQILSQQLFAASRGIRFVMEIILIRHGKPTSANNPVLNAVDFTKWVRRYNFSDVSTNSRPERILDEYKSHYIVSSDLERAIHSANIYTGQSPELTSKLYREMEIPRYKFPFRLKAMTWVYLNRAFWMLGLKGSFESYQQAKIRAELASDNLIELAQEQDKVVLFGHGYLNLHIRRSLMKKGWKLNSKSNGFWGISSLET
ncbi:histidine phosphatase family protein [Colwellia demingiae]|nr:histidine phosphatase family protein [Colwellia demingiae]